MTLPRWSLLLAAVFSFILSPAAQAKVQSIKIFFPRETLQREGTPTQFHWQSLPDSTAVEKYDLTLYLFDQAGANPRIINRATVLDKTSTTVDLGGILSTGTYAWKVQAKDKDGHIIGTGQTRFTIVNEAFRTPGKFLVLVGASLLDVSYLSRTSSLTGEVPGSFMGYTLSGEYYLPSDWSAFASFHHSNLNFAGASLARSELALGGSHRSELNESENLFLVLGLKLSMSSTPQLTPKADLTFTPSTVKRTLFNPVAGIDYRIADNATVYARVNLGMALSTSNPDHGALTEVDKNISYALSVGLRGIWMAPWGYNLETTYLKDGFGYTTSSQVIDTSFRGYNVQLAATRSF